MKKDRKLAFLLFGGIFVLSFLSMNFIAGLFSHPIPAGTITDADIQFQDNLERVESITGRFGVIGDFFRLKVTSEAKVSANVNLHLIFNNMPAYAPVRMIGSTDEVGCSIVGKLIKIRDLKDWWSKLVNVDVPNCINSYGNNDGNSYEPTGEIYIASGISLQLDVASKLLLFTLGMLFWGSVFIFLTRLYKSCLELMFHLADSNS